MSLKCLEEIDNMITIWEENYQLIGFNIFKTLRAKKKKAYL